MEVSVWDTGIGINAEDQERLFKPFEQADGALGRKYEGTGLGLALVKNLAELHGGQASLESVPGEGSRFAVRLPYRKVEKQNVPLPNAQIQDQRADTTNTQVPLLLLIEDDDQAAVLMMAHLKNAGYRTLWARSGEEGLTMAEEVHPDSVLLDILLPDVDGWKVLQRFKAKPELADIPVVVVSIVADTMKGLNLGALEALQKPVNRENLLAAVARATPARGGARQACRVLVVDDDARSRELVCAQLEHQGYTTLCANGDAEALAQLQADPPDLVILDLMMPEVRGFDVLASLRKEKQTAQVPVIILTAKTLTDDERMFLRQHTAQVLGRSGFDSEAFLNSVDAVLNTGSLNNPSGFNG
jgi:DNA-binding response OmpR family regulator